MALTMYLHDATTAIAGEVDIITLKKIKEIK